MLLSSQQVPLTAWQIINKSTQNPLLHTCNNCCPSCCPVVRAEAKLTVFAPTNGALADLSTGGDGVQDLLDGRPATQNEINRVSISAHGLAGLSCILSAVLGLHGLTNQGCVITCANDVSAYVIQACHCPRKYCCLHVRGRYLAAAQYQHCPSQHHVSHLQPGNCCSVCSIDKHEHSRP